jgi:hypothetical protein
VLENATKPTVALNLQFSSELYSKCSFVPGSWESMCRNSTSQFDVILMSETLYNTEYYPSLLNVIQNTLNDDGIVIIGSKTYYFGLGGGLYEF